LRDGRDISATNATSLRLGEKVARRIPAIVMTGLQELQNEGNGRGLVNTTAPRKALRRSRGTFQSPRFKTIGFWSRSNFLGPERLFWFPGGGRPMNIRVLVVDDEPLARVGITTRLASTIIARMSLGHRRSSVTHLRWLMLDELQRRDYAGENHGIERLGSGKH
jgi:hypothetical protein